jgi:hypothetical protein
MLWNPKHDEVKPLLDLSKPSIQALSYALRHKETWPEEFIWNFNECHTCAMGLACKLWNLIDPNTFTVSRAIGIDWPASGYVFLRGGYGGVCGSKITPEMVANQLDKLIA